MLSSGSTIKIETSEFQHNSVTDRGGVLWSDSCTISIEATDFQHNSASRGGVLFSSSSNITIEASEFQKLITVLPSMEEY